VFSNILKFIQFQKERVDKKEVTGATVRNYAKSIKLFCEMAQGLRKKLEPGKKKHPYQANHSLRKWFNTRCEIAGMRPINVEKLMNYSVGISDSYYRATENELLEDYLKAVDLLTINDDKSILQKQLADLTERNRKQAIDTVTRLEDRDKDIVELKAAVEFLKNKMNAALISQPSTEVISDDKGMPRAIEINEICNTAHSTIHTTK
jgi:hypothetical protein